MSKICKLTVLNLRSRSEYIVGNTYNGMVLDKIVDNSVDAELSYHSIFCGITSDKNTIFELVNASDDIVYEDDQGLTKARK